MYLYTILHDFVEGTTDEDRGVFIRAFFRMADSLGMNFYKTGQKIEEGKDKIKKKLFD